MAIGGAKLQLLLAVLVAHRASTLTPGQLCDALWGDAQPPTATTTLQSHLSRLRRILEPEAHIDGRDSRYVLRAPEGALDVDQFEQAIVPATTDVNAAAVKARLGEALARWRGPAFGELADNDWIRPEAVRLDEMRLAATERWIDARLQLGEDLELVGDLERLVAVHPLREAFWRQLMLSLYRSGRQAEALRRAADLSRLLREELGLDLSPVGARARTSDSGGRPVVAGWKRSSHPPSRPVVVARIIDLPTRLVGRDADIERLTDLVTSERLVTLIGPGGVGKTRLARRLGAEYGANGRAATMVDLAAVREAASVPAVVATALDVQQRQHGTLAEALTEVLRGHEQLVVLDNCEHVISEVASLVAKLTVACPDLRVLTTSREPLGVPGEMVYTVAPLAIADDVGTVDLAASPAVQLFCERAAAARSDFTVTPQLLPVLARLCRRLDGLPLAIELAAVRARALGPEAMIERLDRRFSLLDAGPRHIDERHRNLENMVAWSYDLLTPNEQRLFIRLSIFAGSFEPNAVDAVCAIDDGPADLLFGLVDRSMVQVADLDEPRYHLLETLREFGRTRLDEAAATRALGERHLSWYLGLAERASMGMRGPDERAWSDRIERDFDNLRAAHAFAIQSGNVDAALRLVVAMHEFSFRRIRYEVTSWAAAALKMDGAEQHGAYPVVQATVAYGHFVRGELDAAHRRRPCRRGRGGTARRRRWRPRRTDARQLVLLPRSNGRGAPLDGSHGRDRPNRRRAGAPRPWRTTCVRSPRRVWGDQSEARRWPTRHKRQQTRAVRRRHSRKPAMRWVSPSNRLTLARSRDELARAAARGAAAGNRWIEAFARTEVLWIEARLGHTEAALRGYESVIETWYRGGDWANQWLSIRHVFGLLQQLGEDEAAVVVHGGLSAAGANHALPFEPADAARLQASVDVLRTQLGAERFAAASASGSGMTDHELVTYVLEAIRHTLERHR